MIRGSRVQFLPMADSEDSVDSPTPPAAAQVPSTPAEAVPSDDDRRAAAAAVNRKRALEEWEDNKKRWRGMGVPTGLPAKK